MPKRWPADRERDWADDLRNYIDPDLREQTVVTGTPVTLGSVNRWFVPNAATLTLTPEKEGSTFIVMIDKVQNLTWPAGTVIKGSLPTAGPADITVTSEGNGWTIFAGGGGGSGTGLPIINTAHPLFSPGNGTSNSLAGYNDFFSTAHADRSSITGLALFRYGALGSSGPGAGSVGALWRDKTTDTFRWSSLEEQLRIASRGGGMIPTDSNGKALHPLPGQHSTAGVSPYIQTAFMAYLPGTDYRTITTSPASVPTAVNDPAGLATYAGDSNIPTGVSIFVVSINKPAWKTTDGKFRDAAAVQIYPVP